MSNVSEAKEKTFTISAEKHREMVAWAKEHDKTCRLHEARCYNGLTSTSKYVFTFRPSGIGDTEKIVCDCGEEFYSSAGDENI